MTVVSYVCPGPLPSASVGYRHHSRRAFRFHQRGNMLPDRPLLSTTKEYRNDHCLLRNHVLHTLFYLQQRASHTPLLWMNVQRGCGMQRAVTAPPTKELCEGTARAGDE